MCVCVCVSLRACVDVHVSLTMRARARVCVCVCVCVLGGGGVVRAEERRSKKPTITSPYVEIRAETFSQFLFTSLVFYAHIVDVHVSLTMP